MQASNAAILAVVLVAAAFLLFAFGPRSSSLTTGAAENAVGHFGDPGPDVPIIGTIAPDWQTKAPMKPTTRPAIGTESQDPSKPWIQPGPKYADDSSKPVYPMPAEHPYNPEYPPTYPKPMNARYNAGGEPVVSPVQRDLYWSRYVTAGTKPPLNPVAAAATPAPTTAPPVTEPTRTKQNGTTAPPGTPGTLPAEPYDAVIPTTPAPTQANIAKVSEADSEMMCPFMPPKGKLELAIRAWTVQRRSGVQNFDVGSVDMGREGGWFDVENRRCCDHYCRLVKGTGTAEYWSCISPQVPNAEYAATEPRGTRCDEFAGTPPAPTGQTG